jgi:hypothetical protein
MSEIICVICNEPIDIQKDQITKWRLIPSDRENLVHKECSETLIRAKNREDHLRDYPEDARARTFDGGF